MKRYAMSWLQLKYFARKRTLTMNSPRFSPAASSAIPAARMFFTRARLPRENYFPGSQSGGLAQILFENNG